MSILRASFLCLVFMLSVGAASAAAKSSVAIKASTVCKPGTVSTIAKPCTATPRCTIGQSSTTKRPCNDAAHAQIADILGKAGAKEVAPIAIDPTNTGERTGNGDAVTVITFLDIPKGLFRLSVTNTSGLGFINTFNWHPPEGMTITSLARSQGGNCTLASGLVSCRGGKQGIPPPRCTCLGGGSLTVDFYAQGLRPTFNGRFWTYYGVTGAQLQILTMTPVPNHIRSFLPAGIDLRLCTKTRPNTKSDPCTT